MPRRARLILPGCALHLIQRGNNRSACFFRDEDYRLYLEVLAEQADVHGCAIHNYCLMTNHVHLLVTPRSVESPGAMMKGVGQRYVQYINRTYRRSGTLWDGRFRSCIVQDETYLLVCGRYVELNPVRAGMVERPADYRWSSYRANAENAPDALLSPHPVYQALAGDRDTRAAAYRELFRHVEEPALVDQIRRATNGNFAFGNTGFLIAVASRLGRRVIPGKPGRPLKPSTLDAKKRPD